MTTTVASRLSACAVLASPAQGRRDAPVLEASAGLRSLEEGPRARRLALPTEARWLPARGGAQGIQTAGRRQEVCRVWSTGQGGPTDPDHHRPRGRLCAGPPGIGASRVALMRNCRTR